MNDIIKRLNAVITTLNGVNVSGKENLNRVLASILALEDILPQLARMQDVTVENVEIVPGERDSNG